MRLVRLTAGLALLCSALVAGQQRGVPPAGPPPPGGRGGGGRGGVQIMKLETPAWPDGGLIPAKYTQAGDQVSPPLTWSNVPDGVASFVLIAHDLDSAAAAGTEDILHWMLWNIPGAATGIAEAVPQAAQLPDGTRQMSATGPYYRGPGAPARGAAHHYVFELFALDAAIDVPALGASPAQTRAAVAAAMAGHVRGKAALVGLFKRAQ